MPEPVTVAAVQMHARPRCVVENLAKAAGFIGDAAARGARLVALPELFNVGYFVGPELFELRPCHVERPDPGMLSARHPGISERCPPSF